MFLLGGWLRILQDNLKQFYKELKNDKSVVDKIIWSSFPSFPCIGYQCVFHDFLQAPKHPNRTYTSHLGILQNLQNIFDSLISTPGEGPKSVLVEGCTGFGKTTLCKEICIQWAEGCLFTCDELVLLLPLCDPGSHKITSDLQLAEYFAKSAGVHKEFVEYLVKREGAGVTIVIDDYDLLGLQLKDSCYLKELLEQRKLPKARKIVASKPHVSNSNIVDRKIEIFELETSYKNEFIAKALKDHPSAYDSLQKHFHQYPMIDRMSHTPKYMGIMVYLCLQSPDYLPTTASDMLKHFLLHVVNYQLKDTKVDEVGDLPQFTQDFLRRIEQFAYTSLRDNKKVFLESELPDTCRDDAMLNVLVHSLPLCNSVEQTKVLDHDLLVYLAARNVASMSSKEIVNCFRISQPILLEEHHSNTPVDFRAKFHRMWSMVFEMERQLPLVFFPSLANAGTVTNISEFINHFYDSGQTQEFRIGNGLQIHARGFTDRNIAVVEAEKLVKKAKEDPHISCLCLFPYFQGLYPFDLIVSHTFNSGIVDLTSKSLLPYQVQLVAKVLTSLETADGLLLAGCHIGDYGMYLLCQHLCYSDLRLNTVDLCGNNLTAASSSFICTLTTHLNPYSLILSFNNISDTGIKDIATAIVSNKYTKVLDASGNGITIEGAGAVSKMMMSLRELDISSSDIGDDGATILSKALNHSSTLKSLAIKQCNIGEEGTSAIANALTCNSSLAVLLMNGNAIGSFGASEFSFALCNNSTLKELSLTGDSTINHSAASELLLAVLYENNTLSDLDLPEEVDNQELLHEEVEAILCKRSRTVPLNLSFW